MKWSTSLSAIALGALLGGCGSDFDEHYAETDRPVVMTCTGNYVTTLYKPAEFALRPQDYAGTSWYRDTFMEHVGLGFLHYVDLASYEEQSPTIYQERSLQGNVLPQGTHALAYYYVDDDYQLQPMSIYFNRFASAASQNLTAGLLSYPYSLWVMAPSEARYIVLHAFDAPGRWTYQTDEGWQNNLEEVWYARQADDFIRARWAEDYPEDRRQIDDATPLDALSPASMAGCSASETLVWQNRGGFDYGGERKILRRERLRELDAVRYEKWASAPRGMVSSPFATAAPFAPGTVAHQRAEGKKYTFPLVAFSRDELMERVRAGEVDGSWGDDEWRPPLL